ncbi:hypothetical protein ACDF64_02680 [Agromyces sp. MMS24-JH15]|uniref:hypothetical protein n=1 Tax=Agromyces sp. MMS24-JH15 TaxID=3243765 RepID=UPI0037487743
MRSGARRAAPSPDVAGITGIDYEVRLVTARRDDAEPAALARIDLTALLAADGEDGARVYAAAWSEDASGEAIVCKVVPVDSVPPGCADRELRVYERLAERPGYPEHSNLARLIAVGETEGPLAERLFVLERYEDAVAATRGLGAAELGDRLERLFLSASDGLRELHAAGVCWRNGRPDAFLWRAEHGDVVLAGFGRSALDGGAGDADADADRTAGLPPVAQRAFLRPAGAAAGIHHGEVDDWFALAVTCSALAFPGDPMLPWLEPDGVRLAFGTGDPNPLAEFGPDLAPLRAASPALAGIVAHLLADPDDVEAARAFVDDELDALVERLRRIRAWEVPGWLDAPDEPRPTWDALLSGRVEAGPEAVAGRAEAASGATPDEPSAGSADAGADAGGGASARSGGHPAAALRAIAAELPIALLALVPPVVLLVAWAFVPETLPTPHAWDLALLAVLGACAVAAVAFEVAARRRAADAGDVRTAWAALGRGLRAAAVPVVLVLAAGITQFAAARGFLGLAWDAADWAWPQWLLWAMLAWFGLGFLLGGARYGRRARRMLPGRPRWVALGVLGALVACAVVSASPWNDAQQRPVAGVTCDPATTVAAASDTAGAAEAVHADAVQAETVQACLEPGGDWQAADPAVAAADPVSAALGLPVVRAAGDAPGVAVLPVAAPAESCLAAWVLVGDPPGAAAGGSDLPAPSPGATGVARRISVGDVPYSVATGTWPASGVDRLTVYRPLSFRFDDLASAAPTAYGSAEIAVAVARRGCAAGAGDRLAALERSLLGSLRLADRPALDVAQVRYDAAALAEHGIEPGDLVVPTSPEDRGFFFLDDDLARGFAGTDPEVDLRPVVEAERPAELGEGAIAAATVSFGDPAASGDLARVFLWATRPPVLDSADDAGVPGWRQVATRADEGPDLRRFVRLVEQGEHPLWFAVDVIGGDVDSPEDIARLGLLLGRIEILGSLPASGVVAG